LTYRIDSQDQDHDKTRQRSIGFAEPENTHYQSDNATAEDAGERTNVTENQNKFVQMRIEKIVFRIETGIETGEDDGAKDGASYKTADQANNSALHYGHHAFRERAKW
jgi:hypothetical protein